MMASVMMAPVMPMVLQSGAYPMTCALETSTHIMPGSPHFMADRGAMLPPLGQGRKGQQAGAEADKRAQVKANSHTTPPCSY